MKKLALYITMILSVNCLKAQEPIDSSVANELPGVIIKSYGFSKFTNIGTTKSHILTEQSVLMRPEKLTDILTFLPGVYSVPDGIGGQTLNIRGFEQNRVNIYFNGIPLRSNTEGRISTDGLFFTNSDLSIEKGTASLIYGSNSSGNVIRIDNRIFTEEKFAAKVNTYFGDNGKIGCNTLLKGKINNKFYYQSSVNYYKRKSIRLSDNFDTTKNQPSKDRLNSQQENLELLGTITFVPSVKHYVSLTAMYNVSEFGYPPSLVSPRFRKMDFWHNTILGVRHTSLFGKYFKLESNIYYTLLKDTLNEYKDKTYSAVKKFSYWNDVTVGARAILSYKTSKNQTINYSIDYKNDSHEQAWFTIASSKANTFLTALEYRGEFKKQVFINAGSSLNHTKPSFTSTNINIKREALTAVNYQISVAFKPLKYSTILHAGFSRNTIFPRMRDVFGDVLIGYAANPDLKQETDNNFDAGTNSKFFKGKLEVQTGIFYSKIKGLITQVKASDTTNMVVNLQSATLSGGELMLSYKPNNKMSAILSYSYLEAKNTSPGATVNFIAYRPKNQMRLFCSYSIVKNISLDATITSVSKRYYDNVSKWYSIPAYSVLDFGVSAKIIKPLAVWAKINNLFDENYLSAFDQPQAGREYRIGLSLELKTSVK